MRDMHAEESVQIMPANQGSFDDWSVVEEALALLGSQVEETCGRYRDCRCSSGQKGGLLLLPLATTVSRSRVSAFVSAPILIEASKRLSVRC